MNDSCIDKIVYEPMSHNLKDILVSTKRLSYQNRFKLIDQLFYINNKRYSSNHLFDYVLCYGDFSLDNICLDNDFNLKFNGFDFRINIRHENPTKNFAVLIA